MKPSNLQLLRLLMVLVLLVPAVALLAHTHASTFYDYNAEIPGTTHKETVKDLPLPFATKSANGFPEPYPRPADAIPKALPGFKVELYAPGLDEPRELRAAPNGDVFLAEMSKGEIKVFRGVGRDGKAEQTSTFATGLRRPFGIGFYPPGATPEWVYIGDTDSVLRFPYRNGDLKARGAAQIIVPEIFPGAKNARGHSTRDVVFSTACTTMYIYSGSLSNLVYHDCHRYEVNLH